MSRIRYSAKVQQQAVRQVRNSHTSAAQVARDVGCSPCTIHTWLKKYQEKKQTNKSPAFAPIKVIDSQTHTDASTAPCRLPKEKHRQVNGNIYVYIGGDDQSQQLANSRKGV